MSDTSSYSGGTPLTVAEITMQMVYLVVYDLASPDDAGRKKVVSAIKSSGPWARIEETVWLVAPDTKSVSEVRDAIWTSSMSKTDNLYVARLSGDWGAYNLSSEIVAWLKERTF